MLTPPRAIAGVFGLFLGKARWSNQNDKGKIDRRRRCVSQLSAEVAAEAQRNRFIALPHDHRVRVKKTPRNFHRKTCSSVSPNKSK